MNEKGTADMPFYRKIGIKVMTKLANGSGKIESPIPKADFEHMESKQ